MAVAITGSEYTDSINSGSGSGESSIGSITVPADADIAIVVGGGYAAGGQNFDELNWDGDDGVLDFFEIRREVFLYGEATIARYMVSTDGNWPGSGSSRTLYYSFTGNFIYGGGHVCLFFLSGVDTSDPIGTTDGSNTNENNWQSDNLGTSINDMAITAATNYGVGSVDADPVGTGQTAIWESNNGNCNWGIGYEVGETQPEVGVSASYFSAVAFRVNAAAAGNAPTGHFDGPLMGPFGGPI